MNIVVIAVSALRSLIEESVRRTVREALPKLTASQQAHPGIGWLSNEQAMEALSLSRPTLARYRAEGVLPYSRLGGCVYYRVKDIQGVLEANRQSEASS